MGTVRIVHSGRRKKEGEKKKRGERGGEGVVFGSLTPVAPLCGFVRDQWLCERSWF